MFENRVTVEPDNGDEFSFIRAVMEANQDQPEKDFELVKKMLMDLTARRANGFNGTAARAEEVLKDHKKLLLRFKFLFSKAETTIPPENNKTSPPENNSTSPPENNRTSPPENNNTSPPENNITSPPKAIPPEAKKTIIPLEAISPEAKKRIIRLKIKKTIPPEADKTILHEDKISSTSKAKRTIPPDAETCDADSSNNKRLRPANFMKNLETRFQSLDTHVVDSFRKIMKEYKEGKMSLKEIQEKVVSLLYYHEDLIEDFYSLLPKHLWHQHL